MNYETLLYEEKDDYGVITLNRPDKLNALNTLLFNELGDAVDILEKENKIKALIITGTGEKAFAAGADIKELHESDGNSGKHFSMHGSKVFRKLEQMKIPVIAAINGFALGGGCELALACHMRFASENAKLGQPEVNLGIIPGYGGTQRLTKLIGRAKAMELILTGNMVDAAEAKRLGLVNDVYPLTDLMPKVEDFAKLILSKGQIAVSAAVDCILMSDKLSPAEGLDFESKIFGWVCGTNDFKEGTAAFLEKRKAEFKGN